MKEFVLHVSNESNPKEKDEFISSLCFDVMFAIQQGADSVFLKSQGDSTFYTMSFFKSTDDISVSDFLNESVIPLDGYLYLYYDTNTVPEVPIGNSSQPGDARPI